MKILPYLGWLAIAGAFLAPSAVASPPPNIQQIAKATAVRIEMADGKVGSGVVLKRSGNRYSIVTNGHVVCQNLRTFLKAGCQKYSKYTLVMADGRRYQVPAQDISVLPGLDLATVTLSSGYRYQTARVGDSDRLPVNAAVYTSGFPAQSGKFTVNDGRVFANGQRRLADDRGGYTVIYDSPTQPGMSGGGVFDQRGELIAIHGQGDRYQAGAEAKDKRLGEKTGFNRGIPIARLLQKPETSNGTSADELVIRAINKFFVPDPSNPERDKREAIQLLTQAIAQRPNYFYAYYIRGYIYRSLGENAQALTDFNRTLQLHPQDAIVYFNRGNTRADLKDYAGAVADYGRSIQLNPRSNIAYNNRGNLKDTVLNDPQGALKDFSRAIKIDPEDYMAYYNRALVKESKLQDIKGALADYDRAIQFNPRYASAYNNRATLKYIQLQDTPGALADLEQALLYDPESVSAYANRGIIKLEKLQDGVGALADAERAIQLQSSPSNTGEPASAEPYNLRGRIRNEVQKDELGAKADFDRALQIDPKYVQAYVNRANLAARKSETAGIALADYDRAIQLNPKIAQIYVNRGILKHLRLQDLPGAMTDFDQALKLEPKMTDAYIQRANLKQQQRNFPGALADYSQAITIEPRKDWAYHSRGLLKFFDLNDQVGALADFDQAITLKPTDASYYQSRSLAREKLNNYGGALADIDRAIQLRPQTGGYYLQRAELRASEAINNQTGALADYNRLVQLQPTSNSYNNRGYLKQRQKDLQGALADYSQAIQLDSTNAMAYFNRGILKSALLRDKPGALVDFRQCAVLAQKQNNQRLYTNATKLIQQMSG
jgi:tetratricopeptide (TPR) repeat protein